MKLRRRYLFGLIIAVLASALTSWFLSTSRFLVPYSAINLENAAKIQEGMSHEEVDAILGGPSRDESTGMLWKGEDKILTCGPAHRFKRPGAWVSDRAFVFVEFSDGRVASCLTWPCRRFYEPPQYMFRRWLGL